VCWAFKKAKVQPCVREVGRLTALLRRTKPCGKSWRNAGSRSRSEVHGIGQYAGQAALTYRPSRVGTISRRPDACRGCRANVSARMIDGGRTKIRTTTRKQRGSGKTKTQKRRFRTDWREPKLIHRVRDGRARPHEEKGRSDSDGTFEGQTKFWKCWRCGCIRWGRRRRTCGVPRRWRTWIWERLSGCVSVWGLKKRQVSLG